MSLRLWMLAGTACGGGLYAQAIFTVVGIVLMLRFAPRNSELQVVEEEDDVGKPWHHDEVRNMDAAGGPSSSLTAALLAPASTSEVEPDVHSRLRPGEDFPELSRRSTTKSFSQMRRPTLQALS